MYVRILLTVSSLNVCSYFFLFHAVLSLPLTMSLFLCLSLLCFSALNFVMLYLYVPIYVSSLLPICLKLSGAIQFPLSTSSSSSPLSLSPSLTLSTLPLSLSPPSLSLSLHSPSLFLSLSLC